MARTTRTPPSRKGSAPIPLVRQRRPLPPLRLPSASRLNESALARARARLQGVGFDGALTYDPEARRVRVEVDGPPLVVDVAPLLREGGEEARALLAHFHHLPLYAVSPFSARGWVELLLWLGNWEDFVEEMALNLDEGVEDREEAVRRIEEEFFSPATAAPAFAEGWWDPPFPEREALPPLRALRRAAHPAVRAAAGELATLQRLLEPPADFGPGDDEEILPLVWLAAVGQPQVFDHLAELCGDHLMNGSLASGYTCTAYALNVPPERRPEEVIGRLSRALEALWRFVQAVAGNLLPDGVDPVRRAADPPREVPRPGGRAPSGGRGPRPLTVDPATLQAQQPLLGALEQLSRLRGIPLSYPGPLPPLD